MTIKAFVLDALSKFLTKLKSTYLTPMRDDIDNAVVVSTSYADFYAKISALAASSRSSRPFLVNISGTVADVITGGRSTVYLKGTATIADNVELIVDFVCMDGSPARVHTFRTKLDSNSTATVLSYKSTGGVYMNDLGSNIDFNNITETGLYWFNDTTSAQHAPSTGWGYLYMLVMGNSGTRSSNYICQVVFGGRQTNNDGRKSIWVRYRADATTWRDWIQFARQESLDAMDAKLEIVSTSYADFYPKALALGSRTALVFLGSTLMSTLTNSKIATYSKGYVSCVDSTNHIYDFVVQNGAQNVFSFRTTLTSSSAATVGTFRQLAVKSDIDVIAGSFTSASGQSITSHLLIRQSGHVVAIYGWLSNINVTSTANITLGTISGVSSPADVVRVIGNIGSNAYSLGTQVYVAINTNGQLTVTSSSTGSGKNLFFNAVWVV